MPKKSRAVEVVELRHRGRPFSQILQSRLDSGQSIRELAEEWGMHYTHLYDLANEHGVTLPSRRSESETVGSAAR